jgi:hypothetical protein
MHTMVEAIQADFLLVKRLRRLSLRTLFVQVLQPSSINLNFNLDLRLSTSQTRSTVS